MTNKELAKQFYLNGCMQGEWAETKSYNKMMKSLKGVFDENLKDDFSLQQKYLHSEDLRPEAYEYDESFINILFENNIHNLIRHIVSANVILSHIQVRNCYPFPDKEESYQMWHRDSHNYGVPTGQFPPGYKIIFWPNFGKESENVLSVIPGSHIRVSKTETEDQEQIKPENIITFSNSDTQFLLFNVGLFHSTEPVRDKNIRIIYNFLHECQLDDNSPCQDIWRDGCVKYG